MIWSHLAVCLSVHGGLPPLFPLLQQSLFSTLGVSIPTSTGAPGITLNSEVFILAEENGTTTVSIIDTGLFCSLRQNAAAIASTSMLQKRQIQTQVKQRAASRRPVEELPGNVEIEEIVVTDSSALMGCEE